MTAKELKQKLILPEKHDKVFVGEIKCGDGPAWWNKICHGLKDDEQLPFSNEQITPIVVFVVYQNQLKEDNQSEDNQSEEQEKFLSEYEALCRKYQLIIDNDIDAMFIVVPEAVIAIIPASGAREDEDYELQIQSPSIDEHIAHIRAT